MAETRPLAPIKASTRTSPATCWVLASVGSASPLTSVRALRLTLGFPRRTLPRLGLLISGSASSEAGPGVLAASAAAAGVGTRSEVAAGCSLAAELDEETERTLEPEAVVVALASGAEFSVVPALALDDGAETDAALLGTVAASSAAADVLTGKEFAAIALGSGLEDWRRYQVTPVAASTIPAAIAVIQIPLLPLGVLAGLSVVVLSSVRPKTGAARATLRVVETGEGCCGSAALSASNSEVVVELDAGCSVGSGGAGIAALRAKGSSQTGIFTSSASKSGVAEREAFGSGMGVASSARLGSVFLGAASLSVISRILAAVSLKFCTSGAGVDTARGESFATGSAKSSKERCSCKRLVSILSACVELSGGVRKSALFIGRESCLISVLNSSAGAEALTSGISELTGPEAE